MPSKLSKSSLRPKQNDSLGRRVPAGVIEKSFTTFSRLRYLTSTLVGDKKGIKTGLFSHSRGKEVWGDVKKQPKMACKIAHRRQKHTFFVVVGENFAG